MRFCMGKNPDSKIASNDWPAGNPLRATFSSPGLAGEHWAWSLASVVASRTEKFSVYV